MKAIIYTKYGSPDLLQLKEVEKPVPQNNEVQIKVYATRDLKMMLEIPKTNKYERRITPLERLFSRSPFSIVAVVARIKGNISERMLIDAVSKVQQRHPHLRVRIREDGDRTPWFTSEGVKAIPLEVVPRESDERWIQVYQASCHWTLDKTKKNSRLTWGN